MTLILRGTADTIPADVLAAHIRAARSGKQRLVIVDEGNQLVRRHIDYDRDRLIDAGHANWDIFADHIERLELAEASEAILHQTDVPERVFNAASIVLAEILWYLSSEPGAGLREISAEVRALTYAGLAEHVRLNLDDPEDTHFGWMTLALLQECAGRFAGRQSTMPPASMTGPAARWPLRSPGSLRSSVVQVVASPCLPTMTATCGACPALTFSRRPIDQQETRPRPDGPTPRGERNDRKTHDQSGRMRRLRSLHSKLGLRQNARAREEGRI